MRDGQPQWDEVAALIQHWRPDGTLVGIPLHMDGSGSDMAQRADKFRRRLQGRFGLPALGWDERLTTRELKREAQARGVTDFKRHALDSEAAVLIFQSWAEALQDEAQWQSHTLVWSP
jgi:putative Holliday junction resolvase